MTAVGRSVTGARNTILALVFLVAASYLVTPPGLADEAAAFQVELEFLPVERFRIGSDETRFGDLEYVGGFEMTSPQRRFGQLSSMRFLTPGANFIGVADHGHWFFGTVVRDVHGVPVGMANFTMQPMLDRDGNILRDKHFADAEGLSVHEGIATVSFERDHRIQEYALEPGNMGPPLGDLDFLIPPEELGYNKGIETVARAPSDGHLDGARIVIAERASPAAAGNIFAAILEGPEKGLFVVERFDGYDVTDGVFLPDGDLLVMERRLSPLHGLAMRMRRLDGDRIRAGAVVGGPVVMEADMTYHIDNMEAIDWWRRDDGALVVAIMSDDNQNSFQRSLYLEYVLVEE